MSKIKKINKMNELAWLLGIVLCSLGVALCTKAGFGLSMIAAPAYIIHLKLFEISEFFTQGTCEYLLQGFLLVVMCIGVRRFKVKYLLAVVTGVIFGFTLDLWLTIFGGGAVYSSMVARIICFIFGETVTALAIAFYFRTSLPLQIYELFVTEFADRYKLTNDKMKFLFDIMMLAMSVCLAPALNHSFKGIGIGTVIITVVNAGIIAAFGKLLDKYFSFDPRFPKLIKKLQI